MLCSWSVVRIRTTSGYVTSSIAAAATLYKTCYLNTASLLLDGVEITSLVQSRYFLDRGSSDFVQDLLSQHRQAGVKPYCRITSVATGKDKSDDNDKGE